MKVKIKQDRIGPAFAIGVDDNGTDYKVLGGDLCYGQVVEVEPSKINSKTLVLSKVNYESIEVFEKHFDKDGLIKFDALKEVKSNSKPCNRIYELDGYWVFPENKIKEHVELLYETGLIAESRLKISKNWKSVKSRVPVYSIDYIKLLKKVIDEKKAISAWFYCEREKDFDKGVYADLFVLGNFNESNLQIQLWQIIGDGAEVLYAHGLIDTKSLKFSHFDLATHYVEPNMISHFIDQKKRLELIKKEKWIRLDSEIEEETVFNMIKLFFPLDSLVQEFRKNPVPNIV